MQQKYKRPLAIVILVFVAIFTVSLTLYMYGIRGANTVILYVSAAISIVPAVGLIYVNSQDNKKERLEKLRLEAEEKAALENENAAPEPQEVNESAPENQEEKAVTPEEQKPAPKSGKSNKKK